MGNVTLLYLTGGSGQSSFRAWEFDKLEAYVGRMPNCDVKVDDESISRLHARLYKKDALWHVEDLRSRNGIKVNGEKHDEKQISHGDIVRLGELSFVFADRSREELREMQHWVLEAKGRAEVYVQMENKSSGQIKPDLHETGLLSLHNIQVQAHSPLPVQQISFQQGQQPMQQPMVTHQQPPYQPQQQVPVQQPGGYYNPPSANAGAPPLPTKRNTVQTVAQSGNSDTVLMIVACIVGLAFIAGIVYKLIQMDMVK